MQAKTYFQFLHIVKIIITDVANLYLDRHICFLILIVVAICMYCPHLKYTTNLWDPHAKKVLESVQRFVCKVCLKFNIHNFKRLWVLHVTVK